MGVVFEGIADYQLACFKHDPLNHGQVLNTGLWRYSRHPNYFGDAVMWWGIFLIALATPYGVFTIVSPLIITYLLMQVSGVTLVEKRAKSAQSWAYQDYVETTSPFFPWPPRELE